MVVFALYLAHALVDDADGLVVQLLRAAAVGTLPLWYIECCQAMAGRAMYGVGQGKLSKRIKYVRIDNMVDISGIVLIVVTLVVHHINPQKSSPTLVGFTVLSCSWKLIHYLKIMPTFCESSLISCRRFAS